MRQQTRRLGLTQPLPPPAIVASTAMWARLRLVSLAAVVGILASCTEPGSVSVKGTVRESAAEAHVPIPGAAVVPPAAQFTKTPIAVIDPSGRPLQVVAASGWRQAGLTGDVAPARRLAWSRVPALGAGTIVIRSQLTPATVNVFGFDALDSAGIPIERGSVQTRCDQPYAVTEKISCAVQPSETHAYGSNVRILNAPPRIRYLAVQATWLLDPKTAGSLPVEVSRSWIVRTTS